MAVRVILLGAAADRGVARGPLYWRSPIWALLVEERPRGELVRRAALWRGVTGGFRGAGPVLAGVEEQQF